MTVTSGNCTITAGNDSVTVAHGYAGTPTSVWVQPKDDLAGRSWYVPDVDIDATNFILYITSVDLGADHVFRWIAADAEVVAGNAQIAAGNTSVTVNHGYGSAPTAVYITPKDDLGGADWWVDYAAITAVNITIYISSPDPFSNHDFRFICGSCGTKFVEGNCTVVAGDTTVVVTHLFGEITAPKCVWVQPKEELSGRQFYIDYSSVNAVTFTLTISTSDPFEDYSFRFFCYDTITYGATGLHPTEGLYANLFLGDGATAVGFAAVSLLTRADLSWNQDNRRHTDFGGMETNDVLDGQVAWQGKFERAFYQTKYLGSLMEGTCLFVGSLAPIGGTHPIIGGTIVLTGGRLTGMDSANNYAVMEEQEFIIYNLTFID